MLDHISLSDLKALLDQEEVPWEVIPEEPDVVYVGGGYRVAWNGECWEAVKGVGGVPTPVRHVPDLRAMSAYPSPLALYRHLPRVPRLGADAHAHCARAIFLPLAYRRTLGGHCDRAARTTLIKWLRRWLQLSGLLKGNAVNAKYFVMELAHEMLSALHKEHLLHVPLECPSALLHALHTAVLSFRKKGKFHTFGEWLDTVANALREAAQDPPAEETTQALRAARARNILQTSYHTDDTKVVGWTDHVPGVLYDTMAKLCANNKEVDLRALTIQVSAAICGTHVPYQNEEWNYRANIEEGLLSYIQLLAYGWEGMNYADRCLELARGLASWTRRTPLSIGAADRENGRPEGRSAENISALMAVVFLYERV